MNPYQPPRAPPKTLTLKQEVRKFSSSPLTTTAVVFSFLMVWGALMYLTFGDCIR